jgi:hypothetical protein
VAPPAESAEAAPPDAPPEAPTVATPEPGLAPTTSSVPPEEEEPSPAPAGDEPEDGGVAAPAETVLSAEPMLTPSEPVEPLPKGRKGRSSGVFIVAAVVAVACLILLGVFLVQQRAGAPGAGEEQPVAAARPDEPADRSAAPDDGTVAAADARDDAGGDPAGGGPTGDPSRGGAAGETDETGEEAVGEASSSGRVEPEPEPEPVVSAPGQQPPTGQPAAQPAEAPGAAGSDEPEVREPDMAPYQVPVGQDGWALWLYSLPEQELAEAELRELERRGIRAVYRTVDIDDKGRWYRVYVGSFPSRAAANAAARDLKTVLDHDWVVPARF